MGTKTGKPKKRKVPRTPVSNERLVEYIATLTRQVASDLGGFGAHINSKKRVGREIRGDLMAACRALMDAKQQLTRARGPYVAAQYARLGASTSPRGLKLHVGGGSIRIPGWLTVDLPPAALSLDVKWGLPFRDGSARYVFCSHLLEHLYYPDEALGFLAELGRVLAPRGVLRVIVPDVGRCLSAYAEHDQRFFEDRKKWWPDTEHARTPLEQVLSYAGANKRPDNFFGHKFGYDFETLSCLLRDAGFRTLEQSEYMKSKHRALRVDHSSQYAGAETGGTHYSLFVDAAR